MGRQLDAVRMITGCLMYMQASESGELIRGCALNGIGGKTAGANGRGAQL